MADRNTPVTVLVGDDKHPFHLNEQQLCACSPFFRSVLTDGFKETHERVVLLPASCYCTERSFLPCCMLANGIRRSLLPIFASSYLVIRQLGKGARLGHKCAPRNENKITFISAEASSRFSPHWPPLVPATFAMEKQIHNEGR